MAAPLHQAQRIEFLARIDEECRRLMAVETVAEIRFGQICRALSQKQRYDELGFTSFATFVKDGFGVCPRTATRAIRLVEGLERFPLVKAAFLDRRLQQEKVLELVDYLTKRPEQEEVQVELASRLSVRALREVLGEEDPEDDGVTRTYRLKPQEYRDVMQAVDLCRSVAGSEVSHAEAWELITADLLAGIEAPEVELVFLGRRQRSRFVEESLERTWRQWDFLGLRSQPLELLERPLPRTVLGLQQEALELLETRRCWQLTLAQLLVELEDHGMPCFASVGHYASECLGMSASQARALALRERRLSGNPRLHQALCQGRITPCKVDLLWPLFERGMKVEPWVEFAARTTCKVLRRWVEHLLGLDPFAFESWKAHAPMHVDPAKNCPVWIRGLKLPRPDYDGFCLATLHPQAGLACVLESLLTCQTLSTPTDQPEPIVFRVRLHPDVLANVLRLEAAASQRFGEELERGACAAAIARTYVLANGENHQLRGQQKRLLFRDQFTCCAPGCTRKHNLQAHHIVFRSQGGGNEDENQVMLCMACHLRLVHRGYLKVSGTASDLWFERAGESFHNELRVQPERA